MRWGCTAVHFACRYGGIETVGGIERLIYCGGSIEHTNHRGETPLFYAARGNKAHLIRSLIKLNANIEHQDNSGRTAYHVAAICNSTDAMHTLVNLGLDPNVGAWQYPKIFAESGQFESRM